MQAERFIIKVVLTVTAVALSAIAMRALLAPLVRRQKQVPVPGW